MAGSYLGCEGKIGSDDTSDRGIAAGSLPVGHQEDGLSIGWELQGSYCRAIGDEMTLAISDNYGAS